MRGTWIHRVALSVLIVSVMLLISLNGPVLWRWVTTKRVPAENLFRHSNFIYMVRNGCVYRTGLFSPTKFEDPLRGWVTVKRWPSEPALHGKLVLYSTESGLKREEWECKNDRSVRGTMWNRDGTVEMQFDYSDPNGSVKKTSPPWW